MLTCNIPLWRVALLEAWKKITGVMTIAKVQGLMPVVGRKQHADKETGQVVEGKCLSFFLLLVTYVLT